MPVPDNARFKDKGGGVISEMISSETKLFYNPSTGEASAVFASQEFIQADTNLLPLAGAPTIMEVPLSTRMMECPCIAGDIDPVTQADLSQISIAGVMTLLKRFYDTEYNALAAAQAASLAAIQAALNAQNNLPPEEPAP